MNKQTPPTTVPITSAERIRRATANPAVRETVAKRHTLNALFESGFLASHEEEDDTIAATVLNNGRSAKAHKRLVRRLRRRKDVSHAAITGGGIEVTRRCPWLHRLADYDTGATHPHMGVAFETGTFRFPRRWRYPVQVDFSLTSFVFTQHAIRRLFLRDDETATGFDFETETLVPRLDEIATKLRYATPWAKRFMSNKETDAFSDAAFRDVMLHLPVPGPNGGILFCTTISDPDNHWTDGLNCLAVRTFVSDQLLGDTQRRFLRNVGEKGMRSALLGYMEDREAELQNEQGPFSEPTV